MSDHFFFGRKLNLADIEAHSRAKTAPRHLLVEMARRVNGTVHFPTDGQASWTDRLRSKLAGNVAQWALARQFASGVKAGDRVYCEGEDIGIPVAVACGALGRNRPKVMVKVHNLDRPRGRAALKLFGLAKRIDIFIGGSAHQVNFLRSYLKLPEDRVMLMEEHVDTQFFTPGPPAPEKKRKVIASVGLEKRDYRTLAEATADLDVDVRISGFSKDAAVLAKSFPDVLPANMTRKFYEWPELVQLYRDADIVAISLFPTTYAAGITTFLEALSAARPVVITRSEGMDHYLREPGLVSVVEPGNPSSLRAVLVDLLNNPLKAEAMARLGHETVLSRYNTDRHGEQVLKVFQAL